MLQVKCLVVKKALTNHTNDFSDVSLEDARCCPIDFYLTNLSMLGSTFRGLPLINRQHAYI